MAYLNSNTNNSQSRQMPNQPLKPTVPSKPTFLKSTKSNGTEELHLQSSKTTSNVETKQMERIPSIDHVTPKVWSSRQNTNVHEKSPTSSKVVPNSTSTNTPTELSKHRFSAEWRPAPRPPSIKEKKQNLNKHDTSSLKKAVEEKDWLSTVDGKNGIPTLDMAESPQNKKMNVTEESGKDVSSLTEERLMSDSNLQQRKSLARDVDSPGFGSLRRMWDLKSGQSESFSPKPFTSSSISSPKERITTKPRSITMTSPGSLVAWHHVSSPHSQKISSGTETHSSLQDVGETVYILSPKPFRSSSTTGEGCDLPVSSISSKEYESDSLSVEENSQSEQSCSGPEVGIYERFAQDSNACAGGVFSEVAVYNEDSFEKNQSTLQEVGECDSSSEDGYEDSPPVIPPHDDITSSSAPSFSPSERTPSFQDGYLPMAPQANSTEEICYVDMSDDAEVEEANFHNRVVPPPQASQTKSRRQYHEIDPDVPSPPYRDPPKLPPELKPWSSRSPSPIPFEDEEEKEISRTPPPLPPDNVIGRRSLIHTKDKRLQIVKNLQDNIAKSSLDKEVKKLNYVDVEVTPESESTKPLSRPQRRTNYSDVVVISDSDSQRRERSGSGTSEEGLSSGGKKQKNMKKKLQSLFTKDEPKANQTKEVQEAMTDFEKERNKRKRISGRFLKKKKDTTKINKKDGAAIDASDHEVGIYIENDNGSTATSENVRSGTTPVTTIENSPPLNNREVVIAPHSTPSQAYGDGGDITRWKVLPTSNLAEARKGDRITPPPRLARADKPLYKKSNSQGQLESTFLAYPNDTALKQPTGRWNEDTDDPKPKVSFLHRAGEFKTEEVPRFPRPLSGPPLPPQNKRMSGLALHNPPDASPKRPLSASSSKPQDLDNGNSGGMPKVIPLVGLASSLPHRNGFAPSILPKPSSMKTQSSHPLLPDDQCYQMATDDTLEGSNGLYLAADDSPPKLSNENVYEPIPDSTLDPPPPGEKEIDTSKFLQSEPLYQIYRTRTMTHASTKRRMAESVKVKNSSEKGDEWESELMSEELGTSTLWRSIPEVIKSGCVEKLSAEELKLQQAQFEVLTSQASYLRSLNILVNHFMKDWAMESSDYLPTADRHRLFSNIEAVCSVERKFLQDLENHFWKETKLKQTCELIAKYAKEDFKVYVLYVQNQVYQDRALTKLQRNHEKFAEELCRLESSPACNKLPLLSFLMLPMQRVTRLPLLVSAIVNAADSAGDSEMCQQAKQTLRVVNKLVKKCNEGARKMQQTEQLAEIASQLDYSSSVKMYALVSQSRSLVKKGEMTVSMTTEPKKAAKTSKLWLFLFSDVLFIAKKKSYMEFGSPTRYEVIDWAGRQYLAVNQQAISENAIFLVILENQAGKRVEMSLMPLAQNELSRWEKALNPPTTGLTGESIYESWDCPQYTCIISHEAQQPDELSLDVGDVMQVLKKTSDGWLEGERLRDGESGWFPLQNCEEIEDEHVRSRNMKNLYKMYASSLDHA